MTKLAKTLRDHSHGLFSCFDHPAPTRAIDGLNDKIKILKPQACGFRDMNT